MRSCTRRPTGLSAKAVTTAVSKPKQRLSPRATLYSPPPSQHWKPRVVATRPSPGSRRNITSPKAIRSQRQLSFDLTASSDIVRRYYKQYAEPGMRHFLVYPDIEKTAKCFGRCHHGDAE